MIGVLTRGEETHRGADRRVTEAELGVMCLQAKGHPGLLATTRSQERRGREREPGLEIPWFQTCSLHHCETVHSCCFQPPFVVLC